MMPRPGTAVTNVSAFSSRGYLTNGRSALDILAVGEGITMPQTNGTVAGGGTNTKVNNGTSFATPAVSAVIARLIQASSNRFTAVPGCRDGGAGSPHDESLFVKFSDETSPGGDKVLSSVAPLG